VPSQPCDLHVFHAVFTTKNTSVLINNYVIFGRANLFWAVGDLSSTQFNFTLLAEYVSSTFHGTTAGHAWFSVVTTSGRQLYRVPSTPDGLPQFVTVPLGRATMVDEQVVLFPPQNVRALSCFESIRHTVIVGR
jgi:hypothetical protein